MIFPNQYIVISLETIKFYYEVLFIQMPPYLNIDNTATLAVELHASLAVISGCVGSEEFVSV